jgi:hypothetical protein
MKNKQKNHSSGFFFFILSGLGLNHLHLAFLYYQVHCLEGGKATRLKAPGMSVYSHGSEPSGRVLGTLAICKDERTLGAKAQPLSCPLLFLPIV